LEKWCNINFGDDREAANNPFWYADPEHSLYLNGNKIVNLIIPDGITRINSFAFSFCDFESIKLPNTVKSIGIDAFAYSDNLAEIHFSEELEIIEQGAFYSCNGLNSISLPNSVTTLHGGAFYNCNNLKTVTLGCNIDSIGPNCFNSYELMDIYCYTVDVPQTDTTLESPFRSGTTLHVPEEALEEYKSALYPWNELYDIVAIEKPKVDITIGSTGTTTFCSEYDLDFSDIDEIKAYVATGYNTATGAITMMRVTKIKGGTGLYIKGEAGQYAIPIVEGVTFNTLNMIVGVTEETVIEPEDGEQTNFIYTKPSGKSAAFYRLTSQRTIPAGKAYLQIPTFWLPVNSETKLKMEFDDGTVTYIENIEISDDVQNPTIYDLQGRPVTNPRKGIYIVNGKKVIYK
jgi:hypothetical protein